YPSLSALIVTDREANLERIATIAGELDAPGEQAKLWVLPVHHLQARELADRIGEILGKGVTTASARATTGAPPPAGTAAVKLFPDERAGRLLVVASDAGYAKVAAV